MHCNCETNFWMVIYSLGKKIYAHFNCFIVGFFIFLSDIVTGENFPQLALYAEKY